MTAGAPDLESYERLANDLVAAYTTGDTEAISRIGVHHGRTISLDELRDALRHQLGRLRDAQFTSDTLSLDDAHLVVAKWANFESWDALLAHVAALRTDPQVTRFEAAVVAVITGDAATLGALLRDDPALARSRSTRDHRATLLHYVSANGVERQQSPPNSVEIASMLLAAGAEVDATLADAASTTLGLVATSYHPAAAGVQIPLLETLLAAGAAVDGLASGWNPLAAALANGRGDAAAYLAERGARLELEGAAGVGRLDVVRMFFDDTGNLKLGATREQMRSGFAWACEFGRTNVVEFLLDRGMPLDGSLRHDGQTGLHWAAYGGHADTVKLLLSRNAPVNVGDPSHDGTPLGWAIYGWSTRPPEFKNGRYYDVVALLVAAGGTVEPAWLDGGDRGEPLDENVRADPLMQAALRGSRA